MEFCGIEYVSDLTLARGNTSSAADSNISATLANKLALVQRAPLCLLQESNASATKTAFMATERIVFVGLALVVSVQPPRSEFEVAVAYVVGARLKWALVSLTAEQVTKLGADLKALVFWLSGPSISNNRQRRRIDRSLLDGFSFPIFTSSNFMASLSGYALDLICQSAAVGLSAIAEAYARVIPRIEDNTTGANRGSICRNRFTDHQFSNGYCSTRSGGIPETIPWRRMLFKQDDIFSFNEQYRFQPLAIEFPSGDRSLVHCSQIESLPHLAESTLASIKNATNTAPHHEKSHPGEQQRAKNLPAQDGSPKAIEKMPGSPGHQADVSYESALIEKRSLFEAPLATLSTVEECLEPSTNNTPAEQLSDDLAPTFIANAAEPDELALPPALNEPEVPAAATFVFSNPQQGAVLRNFQAAFIYEISGNPLQKWNRLFHCSGVTVRRIPAADGKKYGGKPFPWTQIAFDDSQGVVEITLAEIFQAMRQCFEFGCHETFEQDGKKCLEPISLLLPIGGGVHEIMILDTAINQLVNSADTRYQNCKQQVVISSPCENGKVMKKWSYRDIVKHLLEPLKRFTGTHLSTAKKLAQSQMGKVFSEALRSTPAEQKEWATMVVLGSEQKPFLKKDGSTIPLMRTQQINAAVALLALTHIAESMPPKISFIRTLTTHPSKALLPGSSGRVAGSNWYVEAMLLQIEQGDYGFHEGFNSKDGIFLAARTPPKNKKKGKEKGNKAEPQEVTQKRASASSYGGTELNRQLLRGHLTEADYSLSVAVDAYIRMAYSSNNPPEE